MLASVRLTIVLMFKGMGRKRFDGILIGQFVETVLSGGKGAQGGRVRGKSPACAS